jgi:2-desacetyl-2-hydroxyethyl bacteriochlorophyllide A dehydrogenase
MEALWLEDRRLAHRNDVPMPEPPPGHALVRVRLAGICNTDLELLDGYYPFRGVPGHEFVGEVAAAPGNEAWHGRRVVGEINLRCGACPTCLRGLENHCERRSVLGIRAKDGAFATFLTLPFANLHAVADALGDDAAVFAEPLAAALQVQAQVPFTGGERVAVIGDGKLGLLVAQTLALRGCELLLVGRHPAKLEVAARRGIRIGAPDDLQERRYDVVVECTGNAAGLAAALRAVRPRGTVVLKSTYRGTADASFAAVVVDEITLVGSRCGPFGPALTLLEGGAVDVASLVHARYPLRDGVAAFAHAAQPGVLKVLLDCQAP